MDILATRQSLLDKAQQMSNGACPQNIVDVIDRHIRTVADLVDMIRKSDLAPDVINQSVSDVVLIYEQQLLAAVAQISEAPS